MTPELTSYPVIADVILVLASVLLIRAGKRTGMRLHPIWTAAAAALLIASALYWAYELDRSFLVGPIPLAGLVLSTALAFGLLVGLRHPLGGRT